MDLLLYFGGPFLGAFLFQLLIGCRTACRALRFVPLYGFALTLLFAAAAAAADAGFFIGLNALAALLWGVMGVCILLGYALALLAHRCTKNNQ